MNFISIFVGIKNEVMYDKTSGYIYVRYDCVTATRLGAPQE